LWWKLTKIIGIFKIVDRSTNLTAIEAQIIIIIIIIIMLPDPIGPL
jgi:hypothetical protein